VLESSNEKRSDNARLSIRSANAKLKVKATTVMTGKAIIGLFILPHSNPTETSFHLLMVSG
jgi:hypothetical protein